MFHYRPLFLSFFSSFQQLRVKHALYNFCQWLDSNCGPLVSEAIALTTELDEFSQLVLSLKFRRKFNLNMLEGLLVWPTGKMQGKSIQESRSSFRVSFLYRQVWIWQDFVTPSEFFSIIPLYFIFVFSIQWIKIERERDARPNGLEKCVSIHRHLWEIDCSLAVPRWQVDHCLQPWHCMWGSQHWPRMQCQSAFYSGGQCDQIGRFIGLWATF